MKAKCTNENLGAIITYLQNLMKNSIVSQVIYVPLQSPLSNLRTLCPQQKCVTKQEVESVRTILTVFLLCI